MTHFRKFLDRVNGVQYLQYLQPILIATDLVLLNFILKASANSSHIFNISCMPFTTTQQQQSFYSPLSWTTRVSWYQKKHSPTHHPDHHPIFISFFHLLRSTASSLFKLRAWQSFCTTSLHVLFGLYLLVWSPPPHIPYISSPNQCLLFATHAHTIATCFAVVSRLYYLFLVFLSTPYLELCLLPSHYTSI